ncbi:uncharacterized protein LOC131480483 [Ochotona princeps]|uniref:uncharacterized protein LOC131480483 n=1 Tax=Ochotona princeps TaxID=9978 RepID=UPI002714CE43|nr:uncharacterized protein LOC131480483 [Ochotona princeps]
MCPGLYSALCLAQSSIAMPLEFWSVGLVVLLLTLGRTHGDSVTQTEGLVILSEGARLILNCTYQTSYSEFLYWYIQNFNQAPQLLLKSATDNHQVEHEGFQATLVKKDSSFHLHKSSVRVSDSAVYYCAMRGTVRKSTGEPEHKPGASRWHLRMAALCGESYSFSPESGSKLGTTGGEGQIPALVPHNPWLSGENQLEQSPRSLGVQEGDATLMSCTHQVNGLGNLQWYKQVPGEGPKLLFFMYSIGDAKQEGRLRATLLKNGSNLSITALQPEDSATYLCAATTVLPRHL